MGQDRAQPATATPSAASQEPECAFRFFKANWWLLLLLAALAVANILPPLPNGFVGSDAFPILTTSRYQNLGELFEVLSTRLMPDYYPGEYYRPIAGAIWGAQYATWGLDATPYLVFNSAVHVLNALLLLPLATILFGRRTRVGIVAAAIFACLPFSVDTVPAIARLPDLLSGTLILAVCLLHFRAREPRRAPWLACFFAVVAFGIKESAYMLPALILGHHLVSGDGLRAGVRKSWAYFALLGLVLVIRIRILGGMGGSPDLPERHGSLLQLPVDFLSSLFLPFGVTESWKVESAATFAIRLGVCALFIVGYTLVVRRSAAPQRDYNRALPFTKRSMWFLLGWIALYVLAAIPAGHFERRYAYLASMPSALLLAGLLSAGTQLPRIRWAAILASLLVAWNFTFAPAFGGYDEWRDGGVLSERYLDEVQRIVRDAPSDQATLTFPNCPRLLVYAERVPNIPEAYLIGKRSLRAYLTLRYPNRSIKFTAGSIVITEPPTK